MLNGYCKNGRVDDALALYREMFSKDVKPNAITYNIMLHGLFHAGRIVAAREFYMKMVDSGTQLGINTYNIVLGGLCENSCVDEALRIF